MVTAWSDNRSCLHDEHERVARHALTNTEDACKDVRSCMMTRDDLSNAIVLDDVVITKPQVLPDKLWQLLSLHADS
jgi:hypothetical protein